MFCPELSRKQSHIAGKHSYCCGYHRTMKATCVCSGFSSSIRSHGILRTKPYSSFGASRVPRPLRMVPLPLPAAGRMRALYHASCLGDMADSHPCSPGRRSTDTHNTHLGAEPPRSCARPVPATSLHSVMVPFLLFTLKSSFIQNLLLRVNFEPIVDIVKKTVEEDLQRGHSEEDPLHRESCVVVESGKSTSVDF